MLSTQRSAIAALAATSGIMALAIGPADAATVSGGVSLTGDVNIIRSDSGQVTFDFTGSPNGIVTGGTGDFSGLSSAVVSDLTFNPAGSSPSGPLFRADPLSTFIDFGAQTINGETNGLTFALTSPVQVVDLFESGPLTAFFTDKPLRGQFIFGDTTTAAGLLTAQQVPGAGSYSMSITTEPVPEPLTILGSTSALAMGALLKRRQARQASS
ncbi:hypothetical protein XM38_004840 [Halomicronema hongdechloris C2206]|uniref:PEP-CTERM protein-sorting domain-containing protein n=1 Tax=Halomicronema hongdechloris C2206 TaxID=1641165 RepID=A0A1Z3HH74_9CYAN|nr:PEP-CTERM sorting domain-containing protein [Halomicronema hongdechloris]ASC69557.1 hypothetical protein XM38_004840 [Halomicronema hongdechloris C2206]